jgi:hypothetical protein
MSGGPTSFAPLALDEAIKKHIELNGGDEANVRAEMEKNIRMKKNGAKCCVCHQPIWALGGCDMCFSCTTGEADASEDYEFAEVCW